jgi:putative inorganic carbon (hco3(-)) transporter
MIQSISTAVDKINDWTEKVLGFAQEKFIVQKFNNVWGAALLGLACVFMAVLIHKFDFPKGGVFAAGFIGLSVLLVFFFSPKLGFMLIFGFSFFPAFLTRALPGEAPFATSIDLMVFVIFLGILFKKAIKREAQWRNINHPISYAYLVYLLLLLVQLFNPNMSSFLGWWFVFRKFLVYMMLYLISLHIFQSIRFMRVFIGVWLSVALLTAIYACYQEWFGMPGFEEAWVRADLGRFVLFRLGEGFRKFSFLSDPTDFGILMACSGVSCIILAMGPFKKRYKLCCSWRQCLCYWAWSIPAPGQPP